MDFHFKIISIKSLSLHHDLSVCVTICPGNYSSKKDAMSRSNSDFMDGSSDRGYSVASPHFLLRLLQPCDYSCYVNWRIKEDSALLTVVRLASPNTWGFMEIMLLYFPVGVGV